MVVDVELPTGKYSDKQPVNIGNSRFLLIKATYVVVL